MPKRQRIDSFPEGLQELVRRYENLPKQTYKACQAILRPLIALALECGKQQEFKNKLELVIQSMTQISSEEIVEYLYPEVNEEDDLETGSPQSSTSDASVTSTERALR